MTLLSLPAIYPRQTCATLDLSQAKEGLSRSTSTRSLRPVRFTAQCAVQSTKELDRVTGSSSGPCNLGV